MSPTQNLNFVQEYWVDAWQRSILSLDVLRERGNIYLEHNAQNAPNVLSFAFELVRDGRTLPRPVNYALVRIVPPADRPIDPAKPPFIVVDPRAGHGPGIGGMKQDSEIGVALARRPSLLLHRLPARARCPGRRSRTSAAPRRRFVEEVAARHPEAEGKPVVIANCQAGWQIMMMAAIRPGPDRPDHAGRLAALLLGRRARQEPDALSRRPAGRHLADRARRRSRQRHLRRRQPGRQLRVAQPGQHLLEQGLQRLFEGRHRSRSASSTSRPGGAARSCSTPARCSGSPTTCSSATSSPTGEIRTSDGVRIDLRNIKSPIIVFCSWGDNITPPQQALGWILDLYDHERRDRRQRPDHRLLAAPDASAISASSSPARWRPRSTTSSSPAWR